MIVRGGEGCGGGGGNERKNGSINESSGDFVSSRKAEGLQFPMR